jgi:hypothetical protein
MKHPSRTEVRTTELADGGIHIELPDRKSAPEAGGPALFGLLLIVAGAFWTVAAIRTAVSSSWRDIDVVSFPLALVAFVIGWLVLRHGLFGLMGFRRAIEVAPDGLRVVERLGRLTRTWKRPLHKVRGFEIRPEKTSPNEPNATSSMFILEVDCAGRKLRLVDHCPRPMLTRLAQQLAEACRSVLAATGREAPPLPVHVIEPPEQDPDWPAVQPGGAEVTELALGRGVQLVVPPLGFWRARKEPFVMSLLWLAITSVGTGAALTGKIVFPDVWISAGFVLFMAIFWSAGFYFVYIALQMAYARTIVTVDGRFLTVTRVGIFGAVTRRCRRTHIKEIKTGASGLPAQKGGPRIPEVQIHLQGGVRVGVCAARSENELRWIVDNLREALGEAAQREPQPTADVMEQPAGSRAVLERTADGFTLQIPALGFRGKVPGLGAGGLVVGMAASGGIWAVWNGVPGPWEMTWAGVGALAFVALLGLAFAVEVVAHACCRRILIVEHNVLTAWHTTWWGGVRKLEWGRSQLKAIDVAPPNPTGALLILPQLRLHEREGKPTRIMIYHDEEELLWIAALLRQALRLPAAGAQL